VYGLLMVFIFLTGRAMPTAGPAGRGGSPQDEASDASTGTPIKYLIVIFDENNSFDHYFGRYPVAANPPGEPAFFARPDTPTVNGFTRTLMTRNPNGVAPFRLDRSEAVTCDNDNHYTDEQAAYHGGLLDRFALLNATGAGCTPNLTMGYYDGNTVTALWNYAQHFAMSDNFFASTFGTTVMGHLNLISGQTHGASPATVTGKVANGSIIANVNPTLDDCSTGTVVVMSGQNVGDLLNAHGVTWGWFYGDWQSTASGSAVCQTIYNAHYAPFQYYLSTANPHHRPPSSTAAIGHNDQANHQYSLDDFWAAVQSNRLPSVVFLKPPVTQTGHPSDSSPLAEQQFLVETINRLEKTPQWNEMAIVITYDDSDGWYDHVMPPIVNQSSDPENDALLGSSGLCGVAGEGAYQDRCGYGPRLPFLVISPFARPNFVDHRLTDQSSILRFIEDNWHLGRIGDQSFDAVAGSVLGLFDFDQRHNRTDRLFLDPQTGQPGRLTRD
jgi:phospholipase C